MEININISNYEEFLLSAVDGELNSDEMLALEAFLQQYPHIREELALLESVRLMPDQELLFDNKAALYRSVNYETQLLDYIDNELHGADKQSFELLIQQHPHLQEELNILQQARLQPDLSLRFENKAVLYRNNRTKVRPIWWWSAAAAVVAGVALVLFAPSKSEKHIQIAANQTLVQKPAIQQQKQEAQTAATTNASSETAKPAGTQNAVTPDANNINTANSNRSSAAIARTNNSNSNTTAAEPLVSTTDKQPATDNSSISLSKLAQPAATSAEIVAQLQQKVDDDQIAAAEKAPVMANASTINKVAEVVKTAPPVQGELVVSVTMNGDSKLLNGVANVARFFSKKKK